MQTATPSEPIVLAEQDMVIERYSIKYKVVCAQTLLMTDYVFANDPLDAEAKARAFLDIPDGEEITLYRVWESSGVNGSALKGHTSSPHMAQ